MIFNPIVFNAGSMSQRSFFRVKETAVLFEDPLMVGMMKGYPNRKVIINLDRNEGISIVRDNFLVVEHSRAFELGRELFELLFGATPQVHKEWMSSSTTDYSVDFISESCKFVLDRSGYRYSGLPRRRADLSFAELPDYIEEFNAPLALRRSAPIRTDFVDEYRPFLRVSNYLRDNNSMEIEIGFYRSRCTNGMLLGMRSKTVFRQSYFVRNFNEIRFNAIEFFETHNRRMFKSMERVWRLLTIPVSADQLHLIAYDIYEEELTRKSIEDRQYLRVVIKDLAKAYVNEIGENLNAALNVATDLSKRLETGRSTQNKLQRRAAQWMHKVTYKSFNLEQYLKGLDGIEDRVMNERFFQEEDVLEQEN